MNDLEKLDALKMRMNVTYAQGKEALDQCEGNLLQALVYLEERGFSYAYAAGAPERDQEEDENEPVWDKEKTDNFVRGIVDQVKSFIREGNVTKVRLINGEKVLIEIPATIGVLGVGVMLFSPLLAIAATFGAATALIREMVFEVEKADGTVEKHELRFPRFGGKAEDSAKAKDAASDADCDCGDEDCCSADEAAEADEADCDCEDEDCCSIGEDAETDKA